jgi:hypothetical protein
MLNGGISATEIHTTLVPAIAKMLDNTVVSMGMGYMNILAFFDQSATGNNDGRIEPAEVENNGLVKLLLSPDLDLFDAQGNLSPNTDGVYDSLSFGIGFTAVEAVFPDQQ